MRAPTPTVSPHAPYNLAQLLTYTDFSGLQRVITSGYLLHVLNNFRADSPINNAINFSYLTGNTLIWSLPVGMLVGGVVAPEGLQFGWRMCEVSTERTHRSTNHQERRQHSA